MFAFEFTHVGEELRKKFKYTPYLNMSFVAFTGSIVGGAIGTFIGGFFGSLTLPLIGTLAGSSLGLIIGTAVGIFIGAILGLGIHYLINYLLTHWIAHLKKQRKLSHFLEHLLEPGPILSLGVCSIIGLLIFGTFFGGLLAPALSTLGLALFGAAFTAGVGWLITGLYRAVGDIQDDTLLIGSTTAMFGATVGFVACSYLGLSGWLLFTGVVALTLVCGMSMALFFAMWNHRISQLYNRFIHAERLTVFMEQREERPFIMKFVGKTTGIIFAALGVALTPLIVSLLGIHLTIGWASAIGATIGFVIGWPCGWLFEYLLPNNTIPPDLKVVIAFSTVLGSTLGGVIGTFFIPVPIFGQAMGTAVGSVIGSILFGGGSFLMTLLAQPKGGYPKTDFQPYNRYHEQRISTTSNLFQRSDSTKQLFIQEEEAVWYHSPLYNRRSKPNPLYEKTFLATTEENIDEIPFERDTISTFS